jgi:hypothetical protein
VVSYAAPSNTTKASLGASIRIEPMLALPPVDRSARVAPPGLVASEPRVYPLKR